MTGQGGDGALKSIRMRYTVLITGLAALVLLLGGTALVQFVRYSVEQERYRDVQRTASHWLDRYRVGTLPTAIPTKPHEADIVQVADGSGRVIATSEAFNRGRPVSDVRPRRTTASRTSSSAGAAAAC